MASNRIFKAVLTETIKDLNDEQFLDFVTDLVNTGILELGFDWKKSEDLIQEFCEGFENGKVRITRADMNK